MHVPINNKFCLSLKRQLLKKFITDVSHFKQSVRSRERANCKILLDNDCKYIMRNNYVLGLVLFPFVVKLLEYLFLQFLLLIFCSFFMHRQKMPISSNKVHEYY